VRGFSQRPGIDFDETFSPVARLDTIRIIFAISTQRGLKLRQLDIVGAFLQSDLQEEIFMEQPEGLEAADPRLVCKLNRSLYGLKQAGHVWNHTINAFLTQECGMQRSTKDPCLYLRLEDECLIMIGLSTDDMLIAYTDDRMIDMFIKAIKARFPVPDLGQPSRLLGVR